MISVAPGEFIIPYGPPVIARDGTVYIATNVIGGTAAVYAVRSDGGVREGWPYRSAGSILAAITVGPDGTVYAPFGNVLHAIRPNGTRRWAFTTAAPAFRSIRAAPVFDDITGQLYVNANGTLHTLDVNTTDVDGSELRPPQSGFDETATPALDSTGALIAPSFFGSGGDLTALYPDGSLKWRTPLGGSAIAPRILTTPVVSSVGLVYAVRSDYPFTQGFQTLLAFDSLTGRLMFERAIPGSATQGIALPVAIAPDNTVLVLTAAGRVQGYAPDLSDPLRLEYAFAPLGPPTAMAVGVDGTIYFAVDGGTGSTRIMAIGSDSNLVDSFDAVPPGSFGPPAIGQDGSLYFGRHCCSGDGVLFVFPRQ